MRFGFDANGGTIVGRAAVHSIALRLGVQATNILGVQYQLQTGGVLGVRDFGAFMFHSVLGSLVLSDVMELAVGPSIDLRAGSFGSAHGAAPGLATRLAFMLGKDAHTSGRRSGVSVGFHIHPTFIGGESPSIRTLFAVGVGGEWY